MLEIGFDEKNTAAFLGQSCPLIDVDVKHVSDWKSCFALAKNYIADFPKERVLKFDLTDKNKLNLLALAFSVAAYEEQTTLETVVFVCDNFLQTSSDYKPIAALTNALRYMRDLMRMDEKEAYADIKRLGYLGLKVNEDYLKKQIVVQWQESKTPQYFCATQKNAAFILIALFKFWAICKDPKPRVGIIGENVWGDVVLPNLSSEDEMIEYVINNTVRKNEN